MGEVPTIIMNSNQRVPQTDTEVKISLLEETLTQFMLVTQNEFGKVNILQNNHAQHCARDIDESVASRVRCKSSRAR